MDSRWTRTYHNTPTYRNSVNFKLASPISTVSSLSSNHRRDSSHLYSRTPLASSVQYKDKYPPYTSYISSFHSDSWNSTTKNHNPALRDYHDTRIRDSYTRSFDNRKTQSLKDKPDLQETYVKYNYDSRTGVSNSDYLYDEAKSMPYKNRASQYDLELTKLRSQSSKSEYSAYNKDNVLQSTRPATPKDYDEDVFFNLDLERAKRESLREQPSKFTSEVQHYNSEPFNYQFHNSSPVLETTSENLNQEEERRNLNLQTERTNGEEKLRHSDKMLTYNDKKLKEKNLVHTLHSREELQYSQEKLKRCEEKLKQSEELLSQAMSSLQYLQAKHENLQATHENLQREYEDLQTKYADTSQRLSSEMSVKVSSNETSVENVSILSRPMNIATDYEQFCTNQWLETKSALDEAFQPDTLVTEEKKLKFLCKILQISLDKSCECKDNLMANINNLLNTGDKLSKMTSLSIEKSQYTKDLSTELQNAISDYLRTKSSHSNISGIVEAINDALKDERLSYSSGKRSYDLALQNYIESAAKLTWKMTIQRPPMKFDAMYGIDKKVDLKCQKIHWGSGSPDTCAVSCYVHPILMQGDVMMVQGTVYLAGPNFLSSTFKTNY